MLIIIFSSEILSQQVVALPNNGSSSRELSPQGNQRFQRVFYLITPEEMKSSELENGSTINSIGFTIAGAQKDTTRGIFKVYLQNTFDIQSRIDTTWTFVSSDSNKFDTTGLELANYEWQVQTICASGSSEYSDIAIFSTLDTLDCTAASDVYKRQTILKT